MEMSLKNKQVVALNALTKHMEDYPLAKELNYTLNNLNLNALGEFLNGLSSDDFIQLQQDKMLKIENPILFKMLKSKLIHDRDEYLDKHVIYDIGFDLDKFINRDLSYFLRHEAKSLLFCSKNESFLKGLFNNPNSFINNYLDDFEKGEKIHFGQYSFNKNAFSSEFNETFIDYMQNYSLYVEHPRVGKKKLLEIANAMVQQELPSGTTTILIDFKNFSVEFEGFKRDKA